MDRTSNNYYGAKNKTFDKRANVLLKMGYNYVQTEYGAMFVKRDRGFTYSFAASYVREASNYAFRNSLNNPIKVNPDTVD